MKIIGLEEHFVTGEVIAAWRSLDPQWQDISSKSAAEGETARRLLDLNDGRLAVMDEAGVDVQVLSLTSPGVQSLAPAQALALQSAFNDVLAEAVRAHPDRFQGVATLATPDPSGAARELERAVTQLGLIWLPWRAKYVRLRPVMASPSDGAATFERHLRRIPVGVHRRARFALGDARKHLPLAVLDKSVPWPVQ